MIAVAPCRGRRETNAVAAAAQRRPNQLPETWREREVHNVYIYKLIYLHFKYLVIHVFLYLFVYIFIHLFIRWYTTGIHMYIHTRI